jgi:DNA-binding winged helix-turn-helix (wHTH) protein
MDVVLVRWPTERHRRDELRDLQQARLLLVESDAPAPITADVFEDWVRLPADESDVRVRVQSLQARVESFGPVVPTLDADGVLRFGGSWVSIPPVEARLIRSLLDRFGTVVGRDVLTRMGWPDKEPGRNALDVHVLRLRRRIAPLGLVVRTVRSRGYLLEASSVFPE